MAISPDARYVPGTGRTRVQLPDGTQVSRQTAENAYSQSRGFANDYERRRAYKASRNAKRYDKERDMAISKGTSKRDFDEARARLHADYLRNGKSWRGVDTSPGSAKANYLAAIGRRSNDADWSVGESPKVF